MNNRLKNVIALSLPLQIFLVRWLSNYPEYIEIYFSTGIYRYTSTFFRLILGWVPFSVGDIIYAFLIVYAIRYLVVKRKYIWTHKLVFLRNIAMVLAVAYFTFNLSWGLNYHREPISKKLALTEKCTKEELVSFVDALILKTNQTQMRIVGDSSKIVTNNFTNKELFTKTIEGYTQLEKTHPFLSYTHYSIKESLFSYPLSYMGYGGYLNPFTNEAQVNALIPSFRFPVVSGHEIGHQLGYSAENETNLIGYIVTLNNEDIQFKYSAYAYALSYCLSNIKENDPELFTSLIAKVNGGVLQNYEAMNAFWLGYENITEPVFKAIFNSFLKANKQNDGIKSYSKVVYLMVSYHQKYPL
ncbi:DUF3810 domain-containing protein [Cellulophaga sp. HaHa_2_95]|uniref:DUF3810 domain-containing protein n=1 Tax=Cellulophaga sp. HaHa_2_95 TaxID=2745558 RepID=UPI001C4FE484|nr:DUF3810 domain-containing protein [Cellulophaga sp. HaHa_2_95]QXP55481.1 DUF3810 domain-containing protein [Cellulophaga sp. HaHa_2_95]